MRVFESMAEQKNLKILIDKKHLIPVDFFTELIII
jgi:hypothetical protein